MNCKETEQIDEFCKSINNFKVLVIPFDSIVLFCIYSFKYAEKITSIHNGLKMMGINIEILPKTIIFTLNHYLLFLLVSFIDSSSQ